MANSTPGSSNFLSKLRLNTSSSSQNTASPFIHLKFTVGRPPQFGLHIPFSYLLSTTIANSSKSVDELLPDGLKTDVQREGIARYLVNMFKEGSKVHDIVRERAGDEGEYVLASSNWHRSSGDGKLHLSLHIYKSDIYTATWHIYTDRTISFSSSLNSSSTTPYTTPAALTTSTGTKSLRASRVDAEPEARGKLDRPAAAPPELVDSRMVKERGSNEPKRSVSDDDSDSDAASAVKSRSSRRPQTSLTPGIDDVTAFQSPYPWIPTQLPTTIDSPRLSNPSPQNQKLGEKKDKPATTSNDQWDAPPPDIDEEASSGEKYQQDFDGEDWIKPPPGEDSGEGDDYLGEEGSDTSGAEDMETKGFKGKSLTSDAVEGRSQSRSRSAATASRRAQQPEIETESEDDLIGDQIRSKKPAIALLDDERSEIRVVGSTRLEGEGNNISRPRENFFPPPPPKHPSLKARSSRSSPDPQTESISATSNTITTPTISSKDAEGEDRSRISKSEQIEPVLDLEQAIESNTDEERKQRKQERKRSKSKSRVVKPEAIKEDEAIPAPVAKVRPEFPPHTSAPPAASSIPEVATVQLAIAKEAVGSWFRGIGEMIKAQTAETPMADQEASESNDEEEEARRARRKERRKKRKERERLEAETTAAEDERRTEEEKQERRKKKQDRIKAAREAEIEAEAELTRREEQLEEKEKEIERKEALAKIELESKERISKQLAEAKEREAKEREEKEMASRKKKEDKGEHREKYARHSKGGASTSDSSEDISKSHLGRSLRGRSGPTTSEVDSDTQSNRRRHRPRKVEALSSPSEDSGIEESRRRSRAATKDVDTDREETGRSSRRQGKGDLSEAESAFEKDKNTNSARDKFDANPPIETKSSAKPPIRQRAMSLSASVDAGLRLFGVSVAKAVSTQIETLKSVAIDSSPAVDDKKGIRNVEESWEESRSSRQMQGKGRAIERSKSTTGIMSDGEGDRSGTSSRRGSRNRKDGHVSGAATDGETDYSSRSHRRGSSIASFLSESSNSDSDASSAMNRMMKKKINSEAEDVDEVAKANAAVNSSTISLAALASTGRRNIPAISTSSQPISVRQELKLKEQSEARLRDITRKSRGDSESSLPTAKSRSLPQENFSSSSRSAIPGITSNIREQRSSNDSEDSNSEIEKFRRPVRSNTRPPPSQSSDSAQEPPTSSKPLPNSPPNRYPFIANPTSPISPYQSQLRQYQRSSRPREGFTNSESDSDDEKDQSFPNAESNSNPFGDFTSADTGSSGRVSEARRNLSEWLARSQGGVGRRGRSSVSDNSKSSDSHISEDQNDSREGRLSELFGNQGQGRSRNFVPSRSNRSYDNTSESESDSKPDNRNFNPRPQTPRHTLQLQAENSDNSRVRQERRNTAVRVGRRAARRMLEGEGR